MILRRTNSALYESEINRTGNVVILAAAESFFDIARDHCLASHLYLLGCLVALVTFSLSLIEAAPAGTSRVLSPVVRWFPPLRLHCMTLMPMLSAAIYICSCTLKPSFALGLRFLCSGRETASGTPALRRRSTSSNVCILRAFLMGLVAWLFLRCARWRSSANACAFAEHPAISKGERVALARPR